MVSNKALKIYDEVISHYKNCQYKRDEVSGTWQIALNRKGRLYSFEELQEMLKPGSRVSMLIVDWNYLIDATVLDFKKPIIQKLLDIGESVIGHPQKTITINIVPIFSGM